MVFLGRYGVNLRRALVVGDEHIERERREERTLAVLSTNKKECLSKAPVSRRPLEPPEKELYKCFLEKLERQRLAERPLRLLAKSLDECNRPFADGLVEVIRRALVRRAISATRRPYTAFTRRLVTISPEEIRSQYSRT